jgi:probable pyridine nucleotide-disulfide oxidoreductase
VLDQLLGTGKRSTADRIAVPLTRFMSPPLATVGVTQAAARAAGHRIKLGIYTHPSSTDAFNDVLGAIVRR